MTDLSNSMSSSSSDESYIPPQNSRFKRYSKVKNGKHSPNKSCSASSSFDASLPSCSGYRAGPSSKPITVSSSESESDSSFSYTIPSSSDNCQNNGQIISLPSSLGIKRKDVTPSERQKRWQIVADENKELLEKINFSHYNSLKDSPLLADFRKRKSDPEFRRSLNRPSKAIKIFSDDEEDKPSSSSNGFPFTKEYDDYFRNVKFYESDEELSNYLKDTKKKGRKKSTYKGGPLADEYLLPIDYKKLFESDSEYDTGIKEKKQKPPYKVKSLGKESKSLANKKSCIKKPKSTPTKQPKSTPCRRFSQSTISGKKETSKRTLVKELKSSSKIPSVVIRQKSTAKKQSSGKKYRSRGCKSTHKCKKADSLSSQDISQSNYFSETISMKETLEVEDQCLKVRLPQLPIDLPSASDNKVECAMIKDADKNVNARKIKIRLLSHEYIINDKIPRVSLMKIPFKLPYN